MKRRQVGSPIDLERIRNELALAALTMEPEELVERQLIERAIFDLYALRKEGRSFEDLALLLKSEAGSSLGPHALRAHYNEVLLGRMEALCDATDAEFARLGSTVPPDGVGG